MRIGYARVSTAEQNLNLQLERPYSPREGCGQALWRQRRHRVQTRRRRHAGEISWSMANRKSRKIVEKYSSAIRELSAARHRFDERDVKTESRLR